MKKLLLLLSFLFFGSSWLMAQTPEVAPPGGMGEKEAYSIYLGAYKSDSHERAIKFGRWMWKSMAEEMEGYAGFDLKRNLNRLINSYSALGEEAQDPSLREAYVDTALTIFG